MSRVLKQLRRVRKSADPDAVHDLRVAIRRCRSLAAVMEEVDADPGWPAMQRLPRKLFRSLGALRDLQVLEQWVRKLAPDDDPQRPTLLEVLTERQAKPRERMLRQVQAFDEDAWRRLGRRLAPRARAVPPDSLVARCLVLERFEELHALHARAVRTEAPKPWHALRIALKRFRYAVESLLPELSGAWDQSLGEVQGLLGGIHDLDVLEAWIAGEAADTGGAMSEPLRRAMAIERRSCIERYRHQASGAAGLLHAWRNGLIGGTTRAAATAARLRATARAMDPHPARTIEIVRLALQIFDALGAARIRARFRDERLRIILATAAQLHGIQAGARHATRHKAARDFLRSAPVPLDWTSNDWDLVAEIVRYHRGAEPASRHKGYRRLPRERRDRLRLLAGVLRLARGLRRSGATGKRDVRADQTSEFVRLHIAGVEDTEANAARVAAAKHLLERYLRRPVLIETAGTHRSRRPAKRFESARANA
jgi:CHAD domain-containing protein